MRIICQVNTVETEFCEQQAKSIDWFGKGSPTSLTFTTANTKNNTNLISHRDIVSWIIFDEAESSKLRS